MPTGSACCAACVAFPATRRERLEALEQLRVLAYGERIHVAEACELCLGGGHTGGSGPLTKRLGRGERMSQRFCCGGKSRLSHLPASCDELLEASGPLGDGLLWTQASPPFPPSLRSNTMSR